MEKEYQELSSMNENDVKIYSKNDTTREERIELTIWSEKNNYASYTTGKINFCDKNIIYYKNNNDKENKENIKKEYCYEHLIITKNANNFVFEIDDIQEHHIKRFSEITGKKFDMNKIKFDMNKIKVEEFIKQIKLYNYEKELDYFIKDIKKYGFNGLKRRDIILSDYIIEYIKKNYKYKNIVESSHVDLIELKHKINMDKLGTICGKFYKKESSNKIWITVDIKEAVTKGYSDFGIIEEKS